MCQLGNNCLCGWGFASKYGCHLQAFSEALILRALGNCEGEGLKFFEGSCDKHTPNLLWNIVQDVTEAKACNGDGCIKLSPGLEDTELRTIKWFSPNYSSSLDRSRCGGNQSSHMRTQRVHLPPTLREAKTLLNPKGARGRGDSVPRSVCYELLRSSHAIEDLRLHIRNSSTWVRLFKMPRAYIDILNADFFLLIFLGFSSSERLASSHSAGCAYFHAQLS